MPLPNQSSLYHRKKKEKQQPFFLCLHKHSHYLDKQLFTVCVNVDYSFPLLCVMGGTHSLIKYGWNGC